MDTHIEPGSIIVAVDGSEDADRAVRWAAEQAHLEQRDLLVVSVARGHELQAASWAPYPGTARALINATLATTENAVQLARTLRPNLSVASFAESGDPRQVLIELSTDAHLLVMGSRGRGIWRSMLLGSVSSAVSDQASCPVVVCRPPGERSRTRGVAVGADGTPESLPVMEFAFRQASLHQLPLTVLHCFWDVVAAVASMRGETLEGLETTDLEEMRAGLAESLAGLTEKFPDVPVTLELSHGLVDETIAGPHSRWELIVVGRHPMKSLDRLLMGSISSAVVQRAHATVAVVSEAEPTAPSH